MFQTAALPELINRVKALEDKTKKGGVHTMKTQDMFKRVEKINEKLEDPTIISSAKIDFNSLSEAEKALFRKSDEISQEYDQRGNTGILVKNGDIIYKNIEVMWKQITDLYCDNVPKAICGFTGLNFEIANYFFKLHFLNFEADLFECVKNLQRREENDKKEFLSDIKENRTKFYRIPRGFN